MKKKNYNWFITSLYVIGLLTCWYGLHQIASISAYAWGWAALVSIGTMLYTIAICLRHTGY